MLYRSSYRYFGTIVCCLLAVSLVYAQPVKPLDDAKAKAIVAGYAAMIKKLKNRKPADLPKASELKDATLVNPHAVYTIYLKDLDKLDADTGTLESILRPAGEMFYEVRSGSQPDKVLAMAKLDKDSKPLAFGLKYMATALQNLNGKGPLVYLPWLHAHFIIMEKNGVYLYYPLQNADDIGINMNNPLTDVQLLKMVKTAVVNNRPAPK